MPNAAPRRVVACPACHAEPGKPCVSRSGRPTSDSHAARRHVTRFADAPAGSLNEELRRRRITLGLSLREAAKTAGMSENNLSRIELGEVAPKLDTLQALATAYACTVALTEAGGVSALLAVIERLEATVEAQGEALSWESLVELKGRADRDAAALAQAQARIADLEEAAGTLREENRRLRKLKGSREPVITAVEARRLQAENRRYREAFEALARQPILSHDLIDRARTAIEGRRAA